MRTSPKEASSSDLRDSSRALVLPVTRGGWDVEVVDEPVEEGAEEEPNEDSPRAARRDAVVDEASVEGLRIEVVVLRVAWSVGAFLDSFDADAEGFCC